jgi:hypothetical protein
MVYRPFGNSSHPGKARVGLAWDRRILENSGAGYRGATPIGTRQVIGGVAPRRNSGAKTRPTLTGIEFKPNAPVSNTQGSDGGDSGQNGSSDSGSGQ